MEENNLKDDINNKSNFYAYEEYKNFTIAASKLCDILDDKHGAKEAFKEFVRTLELLIAKTTRLGISLHDYWARNYVLLDRDVYDCLYHKKRNEETENHDK